MAVDDDLRSLSTENVVYLVKWLRTGGMYGGTGMSGQQLEVFKGRLRQTSQGEWVFTAYTGQSGVVGVTLGPVQPGWTSSHTADRGIEVVIPIEVTSAMGVSVVLPDGSTGLVHIPAAQSHITLTTVIPPDLAE